MIFRRGRRASSHYIFEELGDWASESGIRMTIPRQLNAQSWSEPQVVQLTRLTLARVRSFEVLGVTFRAVFGVCFLTLTFAVVFVLLLTLGKWGHFSGRFSDPFSDP